MNIEHQEVIKNFLKSPITAVKNAEISDGLKIISFRAMMGVEITKEQEQLLGNCALMAQILLIRNLTRHLKLQCSQEATHEFIVSTITEEIYLIFPPLMARAANFYVNADKDIMQADLINRPPSAMKLVLACDALSQAEEGTTALTPLQLSRIYLLDPEAKEDNRNGGHKIFVTAAIIQRQKAIEEIKGLVLLANIDYCLNKNGEIDIQKTLLEHLKKEVQHSSAIKLHTILKHSLQMGYLALAQWLWQVASPEQQTAMLVADNYLAFNSVEDSFDHEESNQDIDHFVEWLDEELSPSKDTPSRSNKRQREEESSYEKLDSFAPF